MKKFFALLLCIGLVAALPQCRKDKCCLTSCERSCEEPRGSYCSECDTYHVDENNQERRRPRMMRRTAKEEVIMENDVDNLDY